MSVKNSRVETPILESPTPSRWLRHWKVTEVEAKAMDKEAVRIATEMRSGWFRLGSLISKISDTRAYEVLGFPTLSSWVTARLGESMSSAFSAMRSVRALDGVSEGTLQRIGERNANALTYLPAKERRSEEWLEKAATLPTKEFKQQVRTALEQRTGLPTEGFKTFSVALPESVYKGMREAERKLAHSLGIDIVNTPGNRITVWEAFTQWILQTDEQTIKQQTEGM